MGRRGGAKIDFTEVIVIRSKNYNGESIMADKGLAAALEAKRISEKYNKDFLDCDDLVTILGVGKNNVRDLMRSESFPTITIGNRKVVSVLGFAMWLLNSKDASD